MSQWLHQTMPCFCTLATQSSLFNLTTTTAAVVLESFMGGQQCHSHTGIVVRSTEVCADGKILIRVSPWSLTKDPCLQFIAICNPESSVSPLLNVFLHSQHL